MMGCLPPESFRNSDSFLKETSDYSVTAGVGKRLNKGQIWPNAYFCTIYVLKMIFVLR
jgi:hypothetical protein